MLYLEHLGCFQLVDQSFVAVVEVQTVVVVVVVVVVEEEEIVLAVAVVEAVPEVVEIVPEVVAQAVLVDPGVVFGLVVGPRVYPRQRLHF